MEYLAYISLIILFVFAAILLSNLLFGPKLRKAFKLQSSPKVSVLIPARNEEYNIRVCLDHITRQDYSTYEVIVLNDRSTDQTEQVLYDYQQKLGSENLKIVNGEELPNGWTGKNWACWQLSKQASGEIFLFTDADTLHEHTAISRTVGWMQKYNLSALSAFPQQIMNNIGEIFLVPLIDLILYTLLPLWSVYYSKSPAFSAANGQWIAFTREAYKKFGGHDSVKNQIVEDVELFRAAKAVGFKVLTLIGTGMVYCRMYSDYKSSWNGLSKIMFGLTGSRIVVLAMVLSGFSLAYILPYVLFAFAELQTLAIIGVVAQIVMRQMMTISLHHSAWGILFHPFSILNSLVIAVNSYIKSKWGKFTWKGRAIYVSG